MNAKDTASVQNILANCLPEEQPADDILSVCVAGRTANVDLSGECYARYQSISPKQEQQILYAIVNALHLNLGVTGVNFTVEGLQADLFASSISLKTVLHPDFSLME